MRECKHLGYCCGEYFCTLRDDVNDLKSNFEFCRGCKYYEPKEAETQGGR